MDCGECHVGGGAMEYVPFSNLDARIPLRDLQDATATVPAANTTQSLLTSGNITAFNYFIDNYDADGDGELNEALNIDYAEAGAMEVDCLICHFQGYDYESRRAVLREAKLDATRTVGAGIGSASPKIIGEPGFGTEVEYNANVSVAAGGEVVGKYSHTETLAAGELYLPASFFYNLHAKPEAENCANCHFNHGSVDWKKRGDNWIADAQYEVHYTMGCMGCHERNDGFEDPVTHMPNPTQGTGSLGHDPAKGDAPFSSLYNNNDKAALKDCASCHEPTGDALQNYGAPDPTAAHQRAGLTTPLIGASPVSHVDLMDCAACHARRISNDLHNTGGNMVDATGPDAEGRLADHENAYVDDENMTDSTSLSWYKGKLIRSKILNSIFWRDKNDTTFDANGDYRGGGMDALLMTQVLKYSRDNNKAAITEEMAGTVTEAALQARAGELVTLVETWMTGASDGTKAKIFYSMMGVPFKVNHGISPAEDAWGAGGCGDCHGADKGFYNGTLSSLGDGTTWESTGYTGPVQKPFTMANGFTQATDMHPNVKNKAGNRSIASSFDNTGGKAEFTREQLLWESTFMTNADFAASYTGSPINTTLIDGTNELAGWLFKVQSKCIESDDVAGDPVTVNGNCEDGTITTRTRMLGKTADMGDTLPANVDELVTLMNGPGNFNTAFEFDLTAVDTDATLGNDALKLTAKTGYAVRLHPQSTTGGKKFNIANAQWKTEGLVAADGNTYSGRNDYVAYLNGITAASVGIGIDPVATIASGPAEVEPGTTASFAADTSGNTQGTFTYSWSFNDGADDVSGTSVDKVFTTVGSRLVTLKVTDEEGKTAVATQWLTVKYPAPTPVIQQSSAVTAGNSVDVVFSGLDVDRYGAAITSYTRLVVYWGDGTRDVVDFNPAVSDATQTVAHTYATAEKYRVKAALFKSRKRVDILKGYVTVD